MNIYIKRIQRAGLILFLKLLDGFDRARLLKRHKYFGAQGENCYFSITNFNTEPELIYFGDNVCVATGVKFITHDVTSFVFRNIEPDFKWKNRNGEIVVGSNAFIGANATILYDVNIGDNCIIAAGVLVNKDVPSGSIVGGVPAHIIGSFDDYMSKIKEYSLTH